MRELACPALGKEDARSPQGAEGGEADMHEVREKSKAAGQAGRGAPRLGLCPRQCPADDVSGGGRPCCSGASPRSVLGGCFGTKLVSAPPARAPESRLRRNRADGARPWGELQLSLPEGQSPSPGPPPLRLPPDAGSGPLRPSSLVPRRCRAWWAIPPTSSRCSSPRRLRLARPAPGAGLLPEALFHVGQHEHGLPHFPWLLRTMPGIRHPHVPCVRKSEHSGAIVPESGEGQRDMRSRINAAWAK